MSRLSLACRKLPEACLPCVTLLSSLDLPNSLSAAFAQLVQRRHSRTKSDLASQEEHIWIEFQATESPCTGPVHRELWKVPWHICPRSGIALGGKKARVASQRMQHWVLSALMDYPILCMEQVPRCLFFAVCDTALKTSSPSSLCAVLPSL